MRIGSVFLTFAAVAFLSAAENPALTDPYQQRISELQKALRSNPQSPDPHVELAAEYCRKARDSEDLSYYSKAEAEVATVTKMAPENYDARKIAITILLGKGEDAAALKAATELNRKIPDDIAVWGLLNEVNLALGNYTDAVKDAQWVLDLRPGSILGYLEGARLREAFGDAEGALEFYEEARRRVSPNDGEELAWLMSQSARLTADKRRAESLFHQALQMNPQSQVASAGLAKLQMSQGEYADAVIALDRRYRAAPDAGTLFDYANALDGAGKKEEAAAAFRDFETQAQSERKLAHNANLALISYYLIHKANPAEALAVATEASAVRRDSQTLSVLAAALASNSRFDDAAARMEEVLATGIRNSAYFCQAAHIAVARQDVAHARSLHKEALSVDSASCPLALSATETQK